MRTKKVVVEPYNEEWKFAFEEIKNEIEAVIGDIILGIEHVGSTSVKGLSAKPCIDIDVIIKDYTVFDEIVKKLEAIAEKSRTNAAEKISFRHKYIFVARNT